MPLLALKLLKKCHFVPRPGFCGPHLHAFGSPRWCSRMLHHLLTLARVSNLPTVWSNCLAAWMISGLAPAWAMVPLLLGASLLYSGGCTLNDAFDAKWDAKHRPERLIPAGILSPQTVWIVGLTEMTAGVAIILAGGVSHWWIPIALAACILLYDAWHKQSPLSVITMGGCRWILYLTAATAAGGDLRNAMLCGAALWFYIVVLSLVARGEARRGEGIPRSRRLLWLIPPALLAVGFLQNQWHPSPSTSSGLLAAGVSLAGFVILRPRQPDAPVGEWVNRLLAGIPLIDLCLVLIVSHSGLTAPPTGWVMAFPAAIVLSLLFQRWFRAT